MIAAEVARQTAVRKSALRRSDLNAAGLIARRLFVWLIAVEAGANGEGQGLETAELHLDLQIHDEAADQAEGDLRGDEPGPADALVENGTDDANCGVEDSCPQKRRDETAVRMGFQGNIGSMARRAGR